MSQPQPPSMLMFVGTYTRREPHVVGKSEGIYVYSMNPATSELSYVSLMRGVENPSYLVVHPKHSHVYAVNEVADYGGENGAVSSFAIDSQTGELTFLNQQSSHGVGPCYATVDQGGRYVFAANYGSGSACMLPILPDGSLGPASDWVQHVGSSVNPRRQTGPHAHSINVDPTNRFVYVADLGMDKVMAYAIDYAGGKLVPAQQPFVEVTPGAGPRHMDFHPNGRFAYLINEIGNTVVVYAFDAATGALTELQTISTLPAGWEGMSHTADIHITLDGRFLYGSNRGHDSLAIFAVDAATGLLTPAGHQPTGGKVPRNFVIDPSGTFVLAANQNSDSIVHFRIDQQTGALTPTGHETQVPTPVCQKLIPWH